HPSRLTGHEPRHAWSPRAPLERCRGSQRPSTWYGASQSKPAGCLEASVLGSETCHGRREVPESPEILVQSMGDQLEIQRPVLVGDQVPEPAPALQPAGETAVEDAGGAEDREDLAVARRHGEPALGDQVLSQIHGCLDG